jgi:hypothetical protein
MERTFDQQFFHRQVINGAAVAITTCCRHLLTTRDR